jgi:nitrogen regulatory protein P-II 1
MTKVEVLIRPQDLGRVEVLLALAWVAGLSVSEVKGRGHEAEHYRGVPYPVDVALRLKVELVIPDPLLPRVLHDVRCALHTGTPGDGKVFVGPVCDAVRVRTGERGEDAL